MNLLRFLIKERIFSFFRVNFWLRLKWSVKLRKMSIFYTHFLPLIKVLRTQKLLTTFVLSTIEERTVRGWHAKLKNRNSDIKDAPRSDRPVEFDEE